MYVEIWEVTLLLKVSLVFTQYTLMMQLEDNDRQLAFVQIGQNPDSSGSLIFWFIIGLKEYLK